MHNKKSSKNGYPPIQRNFVYEKEFRLRESPLTDILANNVLGKTLYDLFAATFIHMLLTSLVKDYVTQREIGVFQYISIQFGKLDKVFFFWLGFNAVAFLSYFCFRLWARVRNELKPMYTRFWDVSWVILMSGFYLVAFVLSLQLSAFPMGTVSKAILCEELVRLLMKIYAFVRSNAPKVLKVKSHEEKGSNLPKISMFLYYLYAPTFIYRDIYPRSAKIRWSFVTCRILELAALIVFVALCFLDGLRPLTIEFCTRKYRFSEIILLSFRAGIFGGWCLWVTGVLLLHSIQNIVGELLRFGDRLFYRDWWNSSNFSEYFRKWNLLVSDWLYLYIFKDVYEYIFPGRQTCAKLTVFILSLIVHEWAVLVIAGFIFPINGVLFLIAIIMSLYLHKSKQKYFNLIHWICQYIGSGLILTLFLLEYYARVNLELNSGRLLPVMFTNCTIW